MVMELHGAKDYFDCTKAILATNGRIIDNALEVAHKLGIEILNIPAVPTSLNIKSSNKTISFESIWKNM